MAIEDQKTEFVPAEIRALQERQAGAADSLSKLLEFKSPLFVARRANRLPQRIREMLGGTGVNPEGHQQVVCKFDKDEVENLPLAEVIEYFDCVRPCFELSWRAGRVSEPQKIKVEPLLSLDPEFIGDNFVNMGVFDGRGKRTKLDNLSRWQRAEYKYVWQLPVLEELIGMFSRGNVGQVLDMADFISLLA